VQVGSPTAVIVRAAGNAGRLDVERLHTSIRAQLVEDGVAHVLARVAGVAHL